MQPRGKLQGKLIVKAGERIGNSVAGAWDMYDVYLGPGTDQSMDRKNEQAIIWRGHFKGVPYVNSVLVIGVDDDVGKVMTFIEDGTHDGKCLVIENVVGLGLWLNGTLET